MSCYSVFLPGYSVGTDCYDEIPYVTRKYGRNAVVIGGKTAMSKAKPALEDAAESSDVKILDYIWYGGDSNYENVEKLKSMDVVRSADMLFAVGGGRACDTVKTLADMLDKPLFTFPTLASNCAACTAMSVMYHPDGSFKEYYYMHGPANHTFIHTKIIAESPEKFLWAGIGDALSKECEVLFASRDKFLYHTPLMGQCVARVCTASLLEYGKKALEACRKNEADFALEQVALAIVMSTGIVSNFATHENQPDPKDNYYYNSSLAHCVYYGASLLPQCERHLHGEIVAFGVLCLLTYDGQMEERDRLMEFNRSIGLPVTLDELEITEEELAVIADKAAGVVEWTYIPGTPTKEKFIQSMIDTDKAGKILLAARSV